MEDLDYEEIFKDSKPYNIYKELENEVKDVTDGQHCNEFEGINSPHKEKYVILYKKVSKLLEFLFSKETSENYEDYCLHYRYWVYHELMKLFKDDERKNDIAQIINKFIKLQTTIFSEHEKPGCSLGFVRKDFTELNYKIEEKYLYDYFKNYNTIKNSDRCSKVNNGKYKKYLQSIDNIYKNLKEDCCTPWDWGCSNYFLTCNNKFDPSVLLSTLGSNDKEECNRLNSITANIDEEILDSKLSDPGILDSFTHGICFNLHNRELKSEGYQKHPHCSLLSVSGKSHRSLTASGSVGHQVTNNKSIPSYGHQTKDSRSSSSNADSMPGESEAEVKAETTDNGADFPDAKVKGKVESKRVALAEYRWSFNPDGNVDCRTKSRDKNEELLCNYMDVLVEGKFATQMEGTKSYKVQAGRSWKEDDLKPALEKVMKRSSANESNILSNIFVRISTGVTLFTPFGSRLRRHRKRKQRYRFDFTDLSTRKRPRRFLKRTYRHSDRRRFNVVNIEDELHSSNDLRNIN
ncbi:PIR Superfamily Protein [Plasmodium malariae]|uniref:PIR Superfamily Protein n=1 Tax=Plasmodium malariae TaxID=5858 RepID=A0A1A8WVE8_PLAMA|nr:PIR Superfamily Protein [Plasmodium malariae]